MKSKRSIALLKGFACATLFPFSLSGASLTWDTVTGDGATITGGAGTWDTSAATWNSGSSNASWVNANKDLAIFSGTAGIVTLGGSITASGITFSSAGYEIAGGGNTLTLDNGANPAVITKTTSGTISANLASSGAVTITGGSNLSLTGNNTGLTGTVSIGGANTVTLGNANALGTAAVTITAGNQPALSFGSAFTLNNAMTLGSGSSLWTGGSNTLNFGNTVTLAGNAGVTLWSRSAVFSNQLVLGANTFTLVSSTSSALEMSLTGVVSGTGGKLVKNGSTTTLNLTGTGANTFTGGITFNGGSIRVGNNDAALGTGTLTVASATANTSTTNLLATSNGGGARTLANNIVISNNGTGTTTLQLDGGWANLSLTGNISGNGGISTTSSGTVRLTGTNTYTGSTVLTGSNTLVLSGSNTTSGITLGTSNTLALRTITLAANITGSGSVTKDITTFGSSTINGNNNTYTGSTTVNIDRFTVGSTGVINGTSGITVQAQWGANFNNLGSVTTPGNISVQGSGNITGGGVTADSSFFRNAGTVNAANINLASSSTSNTIANRGGTYSQSAGTTTVTGAFTLSANGGTGAAGTAGNDAALNLSGGTINTPTLAVNSGTVTLTGGTLNLGSGGITSSGASPIAINLGAVTAGATAAWSTSLGLNLTDSSTGTNFNTTGGNISLSGVLSGTGNLNKTGSGTLTLSGVSSTYSGDVAVTGGSLFINGQLGGSSTDVTVSSGTIGGIGSIGGNLFLSGSSILEISNLASPLTVGGTIAFSSAGFGIDNLGGLDWDTIPLGTYTLLNGSLNTSLLDNFGFGSRVNVGTSGSREAYFAEGSLQLVVIPEPSTVGLGGLGVFLLLTRRRASRSR